MVPRLKGFFVLSGVLVRCSHLFTVFLESADKRMESLERILRNVVADHKQCRHRMVIDFISIFCLHRPFLEQTFRKGVE